MQGTNFIKLSA